MELASVSLRIVANREVFNTIHQYESADPGEHYVSTPVGDSGLPENQGTAFSTTKQTGAHPLDVQGFQKIKGQTLP